jgi:hypothetical protein
MSKIYLVGLIGLSVLWWVKLAPDDLSLIALLLAWLVYIGIQLRRGGYGPEGKL